LTGPAAASPDSQSSDEPKPEDADPKRRDALDARMRLN